MKISRYLLAIVASVFFVTGCVSTANQETTEQFATRFYTNISENRASEVINMFDTSGIAPNEMSQAEQKIYVAVREVRNEFSQKGGFERVEVTDQALSNDGKKALLNLTIYFKNGESMDGTMNLIKTTSGWKIV